MHESMMSRVLLRFSPWSHMPLPAVAGRGGAMPRSAVTSVSVSEEVVQASWQELPPQHHKQATPRQYYVVGLHSRGRAPPNTPLMTTGRTWNY